MLARFNVKPDLAENGQIALEQLAQQHYDLVLMDCQMPELDGFATTIQIRSGSTGSHNPQIPIIALTANAMKGDRERCLQVGMNDYLAKPIKAPELSEKIDFWLAKAHQGS